MNRTYYKFQRLTRRQRPDQILATLPTPPSHSNWLLFEGNMFTLLMRLLLYSSPVMIGIVVYWWIGHQELFEFIKNTNYLL